MIEKYKISHDDINIIFKWNSRTRVAVIGGRYTFVRFIENIAVEIFGRRLDTLKNSHSQHNYIQFKFEIRTTSTLRKALEVIEENYILTTIKNHGRLI